MMSVVFLMLTFTVPYGAFTTEEPAVLIEDTFLQTEPEEPPHLMNPKCAQFTIGDPDRGIFFSPNFPNLYPNRTDCVRIIEAPPGHYIRLDFRDKFAIEPSENCKFDALEVRDGSNGYDSLLGHFCGFIFPPIVTSSGRSLWLRFTTDDNTEYTGFTAVYEFIERPPDSTEVPETQCRKQLKGIEGFVNRTDIENEFLEKTISYKVPLECMWTIEVQHGWRIQLQFLKFNLWVPNDCESNFIDVFPEATDLPSRLHNFCGSIAEMVQSPENVLKIRFVAKNNAVKSDFEALYTAFRDKPKTTDPTDCGPGEYDCEDATCISDKLRCNGRINCRFRGDEDPAKCTLKEGVLSIILNAEHMLIILIVFFIILFGMCCAFFYNCFKKLVRDHRIIKEHTRRSREAHLHHITRSKEDCTDFTVKQHCFVPSEDEESIGSVIRNEDETVVQMRDSQVQTKESLFEPESSRTSSNNNHGSRRNDSTWFTTFGHRGPVDSESDSSVPGRATSIETTKSAPDVILTRH